MATETKLDQRLESSPLVAKPVDHNVGSGIDGLPSDSTPTISASGNGASDTKVNGSAVSMIKREADQEPNAASSYSYQYPGYSGSSTQLDDQVYYQADGSQTGMQSDNGSMVYYWPSYPYASGTVVGVDGQSVAQQPYFSSSGYLQHPVSYGLEAMPCYSWDSAYVGDVSNGNAVFENGKGGSGSTVFAQSNGFNSTKSNGNTGSKISKPMYTRLVRPMTKVSPSGSDFSAGLFKGYQPMGKFPPFTCQKPGPFPHNGPLNYRQNGRMWTGDYRNKSRDRVNKNYDFENQTELTRGPRASNKNAPLDSLVNKNASLDYSVKEELGIAMRKEQYNLPDFETEYANAKFFVIKSYSEDDIHKSIKYDVWASTPNGNKKLDAAFHNAEEVSSETGSKCPIFLFFSVNGSGQFVGFAEMVGQVDFNKDMDFWQIDKWNGFFPVKWHVIKDIPNGHLRHIVLENNDGHSVTFSRDTQEKHTTAEERISEDDSRTKKTTNPSSLINLTKNLSIGGHIQKSKPIKKPIENSDLPVPSP